MGLQHPYNVRRVPAGGAPGVRVSLVWRDSNLHTYKGALTANTSTAYR